MEPDEVSMHVTRSGRPSDRFISFLQKLRENGAAMAALRRGLGKSPGEVAEMHAYVLPWISSPCDPWREGAYYLVASLFALWHQSRDGDFPEAPANFGGSLRALKDESGSLEPRVVALLNSHEDDLPTRLRTL